MYEFLEKYVAPPVVVGVFSAILYILSDLTNIPQIWILVFLIASTALSTLYSYVSEELFLPLLSLTIAFFITCEIAERVL